MTEPQIVALSGFLAKTTNYSPEASEAFVRFAAGRGMEEVDIREYVTLAHGDLSFVRLLLTRRIKA